VEKATRNRLPLLALLVVLLTGLGCNAYQLDVLMRIGGPAGEVDYPAGLSGTHWDIDGDLDCDWHDYEGRDW